MSDKASCDEVVVSDARETLIAPVTRNPSFVALRVRAGTKGRRGLRMGVGGRDQVGQGGGEQQAKKMSDVRRGWWVGFWGGKRAEMGWIGKEAGSRDCLWRF